LIYAIWSCEALASLQIDIASPPTKLACVVCYGRSTTQPLKITAPSQSSAFLGMPGAEHRRPVRLLATSCSLVCSPARGLVVSASAWVLPRPCKLVLQPSYQAHSVRKSCRELTQNNNNKKTSELKPEIVEIQSWRYKTIVVIKRQQQTTISNLFVRRVRVRWPLCCLV